VADTVTLDPGSGGATIATDDLGATGHVQLVKLVDGTDNGTGRIPGDATNGLDVDVTRVSGTVTVDGSGVTQPVSAASLPLPTGAATAAKQPALGTAGTASADVITVQGVASMTAVKVDGSAVTQPVSDGGGSLTVDGTVTANAGTGPFPVSDNSGSLTVDAPVGTPVFVRLSDGTSAIATLPVSLASVPSHAVTNAGTFAVQVSSIAAGTNAIGKLAANSGVDIGDVDVTSLPALPAGTNNIGDVDVASIAAGTNTIGNVGVVPRTSGGLSIFRTLDADETEEEIKASAGQVFGWYLDNDGAAEAHVKFSNATAAHVTVGTTTPVLTIPVPAGSAANVFTPIGIAFSTAISIAATTGVADNDTTGPAANQVVANVFYS
jgi:hypothetical protein